MASSSASTSLRRLPFREALTALRSGGDNLILSSDVRSVTVRFVAKNSEAGPRQFIRTHLPKLSYANPNLRVNISRIPDPRFKSKDPKSPDHGAVWEGGIMPKPEMEIGFAGAPAQTLPLSHLDGDKILAQLIAVAGEERARAVGGPSNSPESESGSGSQSMAI
ncbi:uncharacterized protein I303_105726 [Kwoniella dejecticola CBS 10117]|uniref:Ribosomal protein/NADH dehydrogenase domain-containing protein n=1 Tax=Kwoniella dejecticola CBS 10117 TaxID=1296121 RepID=A0A1A6A083_9TREE|nr:uncharacterized protein I303_05748 [Kwoniella dejecticola CBS 10117]OBR83469.1 hypothetical protein I303_05748 [Kwoniella dejecticola CBS 10117]